MSIVGSLISAGAGIVSNSISNDMSRRNAREQREWQEDMWEKQKAYNAPGSQANLLRAAGLNPYDKVGFQPIGNAGTGATAETIPFDNPVATFMNTRMQEAQLKGLELDNEAKEIDNAQRRVDFDFANATYDDRVKMVGEQLKDISLSNHQKSQIATLVQDAYFDSDGNVKNNPNTLDYEIKQQQKDLNDFAKQLEHNKVIQSNFVNYVKSTFGIDYTFLPDDLKQQVSQWVFSSLNGATDNESVLNNLWERIATYAYDSENARQRQAYGDTWIGEIRKLVDDLNKMFSKFDISPTAFLSTMIEKIWN